MPAEAPPSRTSSVPHLPPHDPVHPSYSYGPYPIPYASAPLHAPSPSLTTTADDPPPKDAAMVRSKSPGKPKDRGHNRHCYNCKTADTVTWRRSVLAVGEIACNKCGLYERQHKRPRNLGFSEGYKPTSAKAKKPAIPPPPAAPKWATPSPIPEGAFSITFSPLKPEDASFAQGDDD
ncbi:hypothetical protein FB45DRAFT_919480 [Roridomyces roridus]|uniref:GATA-type domain-containing protein n=1 Tax=Roridomyces roridus TaxID=1738132 RepID=A0AAD7FNG2_9AGAR|nr:hypothetical protein FB45DRAFT_919480 [Roridomyces roridus]